MVALVQQSTTQLPLFFFLTQSSDHITGLTGASPTVTISKNGGAFASPAGAVTQIANGWYQVAANATDTNTLGAILLHATAASADPCDMVAALVVAFNPQNANLGIAFPTNFSALAITAGGAVTVGTNNDKTGYSLTQAFPTNFGSLAITVGGAVTVGTNNDKTGYSLSQTFPTNFSALAITAGGAVTVGTNGDKAGYSLTQAFPANFSSLSIDAGGNVGVTANIKKNTIQNGFMFLMTDATTHAPKTGLAVTATRSIDGGVFAGCANAVTEVGNGTYTINLAAADVNGNHIMLRFTAAGADDLNIEIITTP